MFYFGTNFKMYQTHAESRQFVRDLQQRLHPPPDVQLFLIPPFTSLPGLPETAAPIWIGAQTMHNADQGEFTGEISPLMLTSLKLDLVMLGHAERRTLFGETDELLRAKVSAALRHGLRVLLCVGETDIEKRMHVEAETLRRQLKTDLHDVQSASLSRLMVAYEPVWSIGEHGTPATPDVIQTSIYQIRDALHELFGAAASSIPVLYGGSVNRENCGAYARLDGIDGLFVGRAVRTVDGFVEVFHTGYNAWKLQHET